MSTRYKRYDDEFETEEQYEFFWDAVESNPVPRGGGDIEKDKARLAYWRKVVAEADRLGYEDASFSARCCCARLESKTGEF